MPRSIPRFFRETSERLGSKNVIVARNESVTYGDLRTRVLATAEAIKELGIRPGDRVGICMEKTVDQVTVILGVLFANAVIVPVLPRLKRANIEHIIRNSGMTALVTDASRINEVEEFSSLTKLIVGHGEVEDQWPNLAYLRKHIEPVDFFDRIGADNAAIIYSSGSTGRPKGIQISHRNLADGAEIVGSYLGTVESDRICCVLSFNFDYGLNQIWQALMVGATLYLHDLAMPNDLHTLIAEEKLTALPVMPIVITQMFTENLYKPVATHDFSNLRYVCSTGGRLSSKMIANMRAAFPQAKIYSMFGLTEAFRSTYLDPDVLHTHPTSIGKAIPDTEILVLDENGKPCPPNTVGELVQRGATVSKGYWNDAENTAKVFRSHPSYPGETLVYSGDDVVRDEEGYLYFVSRRDEMIKTRGFRVSPTEVESEVVGHPAIESAVAFGAVNIDVGEDVVCAYTTTDAQPIPDKKLQQYLKGKLPRHMVPAYLVHFEAFPLTGSGGKIDRSFVKNATRKKLGVDAAPKDPRVVAE
jgi:amino acid adenylation domain-containing protein